MFLVRCRYSFVQTLVGLIARHHILFTHDPETVDWESDEIVCSWYNSGRKEFDCCQWSISFFFQQAWDNAMLLGYQQVKNDWQKMFARCLSGLKN